MVRFLHETTGHSLDSEVQIHIIRIIFTIFTRFFLKMTSEIRSSLFPLFALKYCLPHLCTKRIPNFSGGVDDEVRGDSVRIVRGRGRRGEFDGGNENDPWIT